MHDQSPIISQRTGPEVGPPVIDRAVFTTAIETAEADSEAFDRLYVTVVNRAYRVAYSVVRTRELAEDITQEVLLELWRNGDHFDPDRGSINRYVSMVAHARAVDRLRSFQAARARETRYWALNTEVGSGRDPVVELAVQSEEYSQIRFALAGLTALQRSAVILVYFEHCTYSEAAARLGVSVGVVKTRVHGAVSRLRRTLIPLDG